MSETGCEPMGREPMGPLGGAAHARRETHGAETGPSAGRTRAKLASRAGLALLRPRGWGDRPLVDSHRPEGTTEEET